MAEEKKLFKVTIDNITIDVDPGTTVLQAARKIGGDVTPPAMCYYTHLKGSGGKCRTCLVEVSAGSTADPRPMPKLVASCRTNVMDGMIVKNITSEKVNDARNGVVEFLLINHPLDCPIFDQVTNKREHGVLDRGDHSQIATYIKNALDNDFIGNVIDVCPVGALTDRTFRFKNRVWFTKPVDAHRNCPKCSGKVRLWMRGDEVLRVTARKDQWGEVEEFICNECRFEKKKIIDWIIEGPTKVARHSVISAGHYEGVKKPHEALPEVMGGRKPKLVFD